jgi:plastocyanin
MRRAVVAVAAVMMLSTVGCATKNTPSDESTSSVIIRSFAFEPHSITVPAGTQVTWTNQDDITHTVTSGTPGTQGTPGVTKDVAPKPDGTFDEELAGTGTTTTVVFDHAGTFTYFCRIHAGMTGEVTVT